MHVGVLVMWIAPAHNCTKYSQGTRTVDIVLLDPHVIQTVFLFIHNICLVHVLYCNVITLVVHTKMGGGGGGGGLRAVLNCDSTVL